MSIKSILNELDFSIPNEVETKLKKIVSDFTKDLKEAIRKRKISADVFVGGSFAKGSLIKKEKYDVDIFVRFDKKYDKISEMLEKILKGMRKGKIAKIHGSRDYFRVEKEGFAVEIIPVTKVKHPKKARNVTDLSYFHVNYVKKEVGKNKKLKKEISLAKKFFEAQKIYGAESYIKGFSGYALECLIIYYKTFEKMIRSLVKVKDKIVIDPKRFYNKKNDVFIEINESKLHSPVILVDPTWKERNVLAALSRETFKKFQKAGKEFLKKPSKKFFDLEDIDEEKLKKEAKRKKAEFIAVEIKTNKQAGDIAGSKMKKFSNFLIREAGEYFIILREEFEYSGKDSGTIYLILKPKKEIIKTGPPVKMKSHAKKFRRKNKKVFIKSGKLHSRIKINYTAKEFLKNFKRLYKDRMRTMGIISLSI